MLIQGQVGPSSQQSVAPGATPAVRLGQQGDVIQSELHGRYYEATYRKTMYTGTVAGNTTVAGSTTAFTGGIILYNPPTSTVNLVVNKVGLGFIVAFGSASAIGLQTGQSYTPITNGSTTGVTRTGQFVGQPAGQGQVYSAATLPVTPTLTTVLSSGLTGAITTQVQTPNFYDLEGSIVLPPGAFVCSYTSAASGSSAAYLSIQWEEVPV